MEMAAKTKENPTDALDVTRLLKATITKAMAQRMGDYDFNMDVDYDNASVTIKVTQLINTPIGTGGGKSAPAGAAPDK